MRGSSLVVNGWKRTRYAYQRSCAPIRCSSSSPERGNATGAPYVLAHRGQEQFLAEQGRSYGSRCLRTTRPQPRRA